MANDKIDTVVLSGGAPQSPLMAGFLYEVLKAKRTFKNFHTSGAGALMALLLLAPRSKDPCDALRRWVEAGVADEVYARLPVNFKLFRKPGPFTPLYRYMAQRFQVSRDNTPAATDDPVKDLFAEMLATPRPKPPTWPKDPDALDRLQNRLEKAWDNDPDKDRFEELRKRIDPIKRLRDTWLKSWLKTDDQRRVYNDMVELWFSAITPTTLSYKSRGLAAPLPFLEDLIDFDALKALGKANKIHLCVNAYNMTKDAKRDKATKVSRKERNKTVMEIFDENKIDGDHIRAAFSMPFIYPPARLGDYYYSEGADHQPINFHTLNDRKAADGATRAVLLDVLADLEDLLIRTPRDLWDAYVISIMTPVVALAHEDVDDFEKDVTKHGVTLVHADWKVPVEFQPYIMDWSHTNLEKLFETGREAGLVFLNGDGKTKPPHVNDLLTYKEVFGSDPPNCR
jgi:hypothetical protein